jgi:orotate phosphoribosyltransferase
VKRLSKRRNSEVIEKKIRKILTRTGALKFGAFKLTNGKISPYYVDLRIIPSFPDAFQKITDFYVDFIKNEIEMYDVERIAGIPIAGIPFASVIAYSLKKPFLYVREGERFHGRRKRIEGMIAPGDRVLLIDDLVTTGLSLEKAAKAITSEGGLISDAVVLLDRQEGGKERLAKSTVRLHALLDIRETASKLQELGAIDEDQLKTILNQTKSR